MEWSKRRLQTIEPVPSSASVSSALDNVHGVLYSTGLLEKAWVGAIVNTLLPGTPSQRNAGVMQRTFDEFLSVLEESINEELKTSLKLFTLFESIDRQFLNLQRTVIRETDQQEQDEDALLGSLWARVIGARAADVRKFGKNKQLLVDVRRKTVLNKHTLQNHNGKLLTLKSNLEVLRKKLVSPLVRSNDSSVLSIEEQIAGLDDVYMHLSGVREQQKHKKMQKLYDRPTNRVTLEMEEMEDRSH